MNNEDHSDRRIQIDLASKVIGASYNDIVLQSILRVKRSRNVLFYFNCYDVRIES